MSNKPATKDDTGTESAEPADAGTSPAFERDLFIRYVTMSEASAWEFLGRDNTALVVDRGPADPQRYKPGARVFHIYSVNHISTQAAQVHAAQNT